MCMHVYIYIYIYMYMYIYIYIYRERERERDNSTASESQNLRQLRVFREVVSIRTFATRAREDLPSWIHPS